ncbi:histidine phosphatase superfamily [Mycena rebaudengoi]|nr:histidine phosphatase superfamily [Mycena rebaudengoi]
MPFAQVINYRPVMVLLCVSGLFLSYLTIANAAAASSFAGSTVTAVFPPANVTLTATDTFFPGPNEVGYAGPTLTGDEAAAIATAPAVALVDSVFPLVIPSTSEKNSRFDVLQHFGSLSPFRSVDSLGLPDASARVPEGCRITAVHLLHRHGARYPTTGGSPSAFAAALNAAATTTGFNASGPLTFLNTWTYKLGAETLTPFGRSEMFNLGVGFRIKYGELLKHAKDLPVFRTTSEARMVDSALNFAAGMFGVQEYQHDYHQLIEVEGDVLTNSTLAPWNCPILDTDVAAFGSTQALKWANIYLLPAQKRLSPFIAGFPLTISKLSAMQSLCVYETVALGYSVFCELFTEDEWKGFSYLIDLQFWYGFGPGAPFASAMGIGWVQELVSRLTQTRITDSHSTVNASIVSSNVTFPFGQPIYVDATHDTVISAIVTALNFTTLAANGPLPTDKIPANQTYFANKIAPFAANLVGQVLSCAAASEDPTHIRWVLNDAVVPLTGIKGCSKNKDGLCELPKFIAGMKQRITEVDFDFDCFGNYTMPDPDNIVDGRYPQTLRG